MTGLGFSGKGGSPSSILVATKTLTNAQILTLPSTPVELVAAPGTGKALIFFGAFFETTYATDYSNVHADSRGVIANANWGRDHSTLIKTNGLFTVTSGIGFLPPVAIQDTLAGWESYLLGINGMGSKTDTGFFLHVDNAGNGDFTGGNAANTLEITIFYYIVDL